MEYRPQLDALRAIAVLGVLFSHFWVPSSDAGGMGVMLFFVLSGFLITRLLLERPTLLDFYGRRAARLLPAFYLALAAAVALDLPEMRATWKWHFAGLTNLRIFLRQSFDGAWPADHLWSLNVEWQFYFVWPFLVLFISRRFLPYILVCIFTIGPFYRLFATSDSMWTLPFASFDSLSAGALLALYTGALTPVYVAGLVAAPLTVWGLVDFNQLVQFASVFTFAALVLAGWHNAFKFLEIRPLVELGKISYGVYLYHLFIWAVLFPYGWREHGPKLFFAVSALTIGGAWISYTYFEAPIRSLGKRYFRFA